MEENKKTELVDLPPRKLALRNKNCPYCLATFQTKSERTREHVVARNFVPQGTLVDGGNLVLWACVRCNEEKSDLEDDISAISMLPCIGVAFEEDDPRARDFERKAKGSISRSSRKPVRDSLVEQNVSGSLMPGMNFKIGMIGPPHVDEKRLYDLAHFHVGALDYLTRYDFDRCIGNRNAGVFGPVANARPGDWGNERMRAFMNETRGWETVAKSTMASGFFRIIVRRRIEDLVWSWAVEYNKCFRVVGFMGEEASVRKYFGIIPKLKMKPLSPDGTLRGRQEISLDPKDDVLFEIDRTL